MALVTSLSGTAITYNQFGVPSIGQTAGLGILQPKLKQRYRVTFAGGAFSPTLNGQAVSGQITATALTQNMVTCGRPQQQFNNTPLHSYNNIVYIPQKPEWQPIEMTLRDDISNTVTSLVSAQRSMQMNSYSQSAAPAGSNFKFSIQIDILDGTMEVDNTIESFVLLGCYLESINYDSLDFASSEPVMITLSIRYDDALQGDEIGIQSLINSLASNPSQVLAGP